MPQPDTKPAIVLDSSYELSNEISKIRFRVLTRVSDDKLRSIPQQLADCAAYVQGLTRDAVIDGLYNLGEHSGFSMTESEVYRRMLDDARAGKFHALVVRDTSRLGRDYWEKLGTLRDLRSAKIEFHVVEDGGRFDFEDRLSKVKSWASTWADEEKKKEEIRKSLRATEARREMGFPTVPPPLGYRVVRDPDMGRKVWKLDAAAAKVSALFDAFVAEPALTFSELGRRCGLDAKQVARALRNRAYTGGFVWQGGFRRCAPEVVPAIVDEGTFERAQAALAARRDDA
ncbi:MAG TPA: recombinase family protein [Candidatus Thermoplasmatota archaeon]|nr:recombinase family protein [Candidatus Thermoplasmatota archaeon]